MLAPIVEQPKALAKTDQGGVLIVQFEPEAVDLPAGGPDGFAPVIARGGDLEHAGSPPPGPASRR